MLAIYSVFQQGSTSQVNSRFVGEWGQGCKRVWGRRDANTGTDSEMKRVMQDKKLYCLNRVKKTTEYHPALHDVHLKSWVRMSLTIWHEVIHEPYPKFKFKFKCKDMHYVGKGVHIPDYHHAYMFFLNISFQFYLVFSRIEVRLLCRPLSFLNSFFSIFLVNHGFLEFASWLGHLVPLIERCSAIAYKCTPIVYLPLCASSLGKTYILVWWVWWSNAIFWWGHEWQIWFDIDCTY